MPDPRRRILAPRLILRIRHAARMPRESWEGVAELAERRGELQRALDPCVDANVEPEPASFRHALFLPLAHRPVFSALVIRPENSGVGERLAPLFDGHFGPALWMLGAELVEVIRESNVVE